MPSSLYKPLHPPEGGAPRAFVCNECGAVTRTNRGMHLHLTVCHGVRFQPTLFGEEPDPVKSADLPKGVKRA